MSGNHHLQAFKELTHAAHDASTRNEIVRAEALYEALHLIESCMSYDDYQTATAWHRNVFLPPASQLPPLVHCAPARCALPSLPLSSPTQESREPSR